MNRSTIRNLLVLALVIFFTMGTSSCLFFGGSKKSPLAGTKAAPDAVLYNEAMNDIKHGRYTVARLSLQTLINTYPDSEYLAKAKLAIANSYYKQGGTEGLTQAVAEYKDFITFFPFLHEAAFAQYRAAMGHFRMMEKPDRDPTQALEAEAELQTMILKYPHSKWTAEAQQRLREVQEVLAEGQFEVAEFYELRGAYSAAAARLLELTKRYPLFSEADKANWMLGNIYQKVEQKKYAASFYSNIVREYPLSPLVPEAKKHLVALGFPVPQPDPKALARMQKEEQYEKEHHGNRLVEDALGIIKSRPDLSRAAHYGQPDLTPETDIISARQVLQPSVVTSAANSAAMELGNKISVSSISTGGSGTAASSAPAGSATGDSVSASGAAAAPTGKNPSSSVEDPSKGPTQTKANAAKSKDKKSKDEKKDHLSANKKKKKKGLLHKIIPW
jgi:outer membrane protein assembly factor BamD